MPTYRYTGAYPRRWHDLTNPDGSTLSLEPGQTVTLKEAADDPWLELVNRSKSKADDAPPAETAPTSQE